MYAIAAVKLNVFVKAITLLNPTRKERHVKIWLSVLIDVGTELYWGGELAYILEYSATCLKPNALKHSVKYW